MSRSEWIQLSLYVLRLLTHHGVSDLDWFFPRGCPSVCPYSTRILHSQASRQSLTLLKLIHCLSNFSDMDTYTLNITIDPVQYPKFIAVRIHTLEDHESE
jgi:hypothetical protein